VGEFIMNDEELITAVREQRTKVHSTTPLEQIVSRGRAVRARRCIPGLAAGLAVVAGAALAVTTLLPGSHQARHQPTAQLAVWTVTKQADGTVRVTIPVTIGELRNPAGLQSTLRADGVPASVTAVGHENPSCRRYPAGPTLLHKVISFTFEVPRHPLQGSQASMPNPQLVAVILIHTSALPRSTGVQIASNFAQLSPTAARETVNRPGLVYASSQCTG
jgi:hypothetical protein